MSTTAGVRIEKVREYYDLNPAHEWGRLERRILEFPVTMHFLLRHLPRESQAILDIGGGPGRYTLALAARGHRVSLADLSAGNLAFARRRAEEEGLPVTEFCAADARDLGRWSDSSFDALLCFGPLYHLSLAEDRDRVLRECLRVLRPGGIAAFAFISRYAPIYDLLADGPAGLETRRERLEAFLATGLHRSEDSGNDFCDAYFVDPDAARAWVGGFGLHELAWFGAESLMSQSEPRLAAAAPELRARWIDFACATASSPAGIYGSEHVVYIGRKGP